MLEIDYKKKTTIGRTIQPLTTINLPIPGRATRNIYVCCCVLFLVILLNVAT